MDVIHDVFFLLPSAGAGCSLLRESFCRLIRPLGLVLAAMGEGERREAVHISNDVEKQAVHRRGLSDFALECAAGKRCRPRVLDEYGHFRRSRNLLAAEWF